MSNKTTNEPRVCQLGEPMMHGPRPYRWCKVHDELMLTCDQKFGSRFVEPTPRICQRGQFVMDSEEIKQGRWNVYYCVPCRTANRDHIIEHRPSRPTNSSSTWGAGVATTVRHCTGCGAEDGPWVSSESVGGFW